MRARTAEATGELRALQQLGDLTDREQAVVRYALELLSGSAWAAPEDLAAGR